jgi:hypothetical protein
MAEVDFRTASLDKILRPFFREGCVLLRNFAEVDRLTKLINVVDDLYGEIRDIHVNPRDMVQRGLPQFHEYIFDEKHNALLGEIFEGDYRVSEESCARRIDTTGGGEQWQTPLGPHLDAFFHPFAFTVNFWVPFRDCGIDAPSLATVRAPFQEILNFSGYDGRPEPHGPHGEWNLAGFDPDVRAVANSPAPVAVERIRTIFAQRIWTPAYTIGDAMMLSNWTLHFSHSLPDMRHRRGNVELRFRSDAHLPQIMDRHARLIAGSVSSWWRTLVRRFRSSNGGQ